MNVIRFDPEAHARVQALLPWYVTGRLEADERTEVETHLASCGRCSAELVLERQLHASQAVPEPVADADRGWARMQRRIGDPRPRAAASASASSRAPGGARWRGWPWLAGAQFAAIVLLLAVLVAPRLDDAAYHGLGSAGPSSNMNANAVVMFAPSTTEAQIRQALRDSGARLVGGPTATHAYLLLLPQADTAALERLRAEPGVTLAEPLTAGGAP